MLIIKAYKAIKAPMCSKGDHIHIENDKYVWKRSPKRFVALDQKIDKWIVVTSRH